MCFLSPVASVNQWWIELNWSRKTLLGLVSSCTDKTLDERMLGVGGKEAERAYLLWQGLFCLLLGWERHLRMRKLEKRRCVDRISIRTEPNWKVQRSHQVKGQPPESVKATTVGTDRSQYGSDTHSHHPLWHADTHTHTTQPAFVLLAGFCCLSNAEFTYTAICRPVTAVAYLRPQDHRGSEKTVRKRRWLSYPSHRASLLMAAFSEVACIAHSGTRLDMYWHRHAERTVPSLMVSKAPF